MRRLRQRPPPPAASLACSSHPTPPGQLDPALPPTPFLLLDSAAPPPLHPLPLTRSPLRSLRGSRSFLSPAGGILEHGRPCWPCGRRLRSLPPGAASEAQECEASARAAPLAPMAPVHPGGLLFARPSVRRSSSARAPSSSLRASPSLCAPRR